MSAFVYTIIFVVLVLFLFSFACEITYYVKSTGEIRPADKAGTIKNLVTGKVTEINISNGTSVKKGDVLLKIDTATTKQTISALTEKRDICKADIRSLSLFKNSISLNDNLFNSSELDITEFKNDTMSVYYKACNRLDKLNFELTQIDYLIESIKNQKCTFPNMNANSIYPKKYQDYLTNIEKYTQAIKSLTEIKDCIGKSYILGEEKKAKYIKSQDNLKAYQLELKKYKYDYLELMQQIRAELFSFLNDLSTSIPNIKTLINENSEKIIAEKNKLDALLYAFDEINLQQQNLYTINLDIKQLNFNLLNAEVISPIDGQINMSNEIMCSDYLQSGIELATILPIYKVKYKVLVYISSSDICKIRVNQKIKLTFPSLPLHKFSEFYGTLINICSETKTDSASGCLYYIAECTLDNDSIKSFENLFSTPFNSVECGAKVITKRSKIFYWLLEKLKLVSN